MGNSSCKIMDYCRPANEDNVEGVQTLPEPMRLRKLIIARNLKKTHWVRAAKDQKKYKLLSKSRKGGEWGQITQGPIGRHDGKAQVHWKGDMHDYTNCKIMEYSQTKPPAEILSVRRRMASRDSPASPGRRLLHRHRLANPYRDSPVLTRLLEEIREADRQ